MIFPNGFDDELSRSPYREFLACQRPEVFDAFRTFIEEEKPELIVEIGVAYGGLSLSLFESSSFYNCKFIAYDIVENSTSSKLRRYGVDFRIENIFNEEYKHFYSLKKYFLNEFNSYKGKKLILCDGGNKVGEFNAFAKLLNVGDLLFSHDFSYDQEDYENHSIWGWNEIMEKDIIDSMNNFHLSYYKMNIWHPLAWVSTKKIL